MPHMNITIHRCDLKVPSWDFDFDKELAFNECVIIEQGMGSGKTAIAFAFKDSATGKNYVVQTSADILRSLVAAVKGAEEHWAANPVENIWKK